MNLLDKIKSVFIRPKQIKHHETRNYNGYVGGMFQDLFDGDKFPGSFGPTKDYRFVDYYTLRRRSMQLFTENPYAKGMIRRLLRNEIHKGLSLESTPQERVLGLSEDFLMEWSESVETDWLIWSKNEDLVDFKRQKNFTDITNDLRMTSIISGDCLVVTRIDPRTGLPNIDLIDGTNVVTPFGEKVANGHRIVHGVELDSKDRHVAYWVQTSDNRGNAGKIKRIPAFGAKSGRRISWLVYGTERRLDDVRGEPILSNMLYMLKDLDRYRDSEQRAAVVASMLAYFIKKDGPGISTNPVDNGAVKKGTEEVTQPDGSTKNWNYADGLPGAVFQQLAVGETPEAWDPKRPSTNFGKFEEIIINTFAWSLEVPPEIARLLFQSNFSASRQANNEFSIYLSYRYAKMGTDFHQKVYVEWLVQRELMGISTTPGFVEAWRDKTKWLEFGAWISADWLGLSRPSVDLKKDVDAASKALDYGFTTQDQQCKKISGMSYDTVLKRRKREILAAEKAGVSFASEENQNREPIDGDGQNNQQNNTISNFKLLENKIVNIAEDIEELKEGGSHG